MQRLILLLFLVTWGVCWPMFEAAHEPGLKIDRNSLLAASSNTSAVISDRTLFLSQRINTTLAGVVFVFTAATYWLLMSYTASMASEIILPSRWLRDNVVAVLSATWPKIYLDASQDKLQNTAFGWMLFSMHKLSAREDGSTEYPFYEVKGFGDIEPTERNFSQCAEDFMLKFRIFSPVVKVLVQIAIWNSFSFWLVLVMLVETLVYNGFTDKNITNDNRVRMAMVTIYAVANLSHQIRATILLYRNFTTVLFQACWVIICSQFVFGPHSYEIRSIRDPKAGRIHFGEVTWTSYNFELFGTTELSDTFKLASDDPIGNEQAGKGFVLWPKDDKRRQQTLKVQAKDESPFDKFAKPLREAEIKAYEKVADSSLEKTLANVAVLLGICLASALAPWTSTQTFDATNQQLGSYALLLSISTGLLALLSSLTQLTNATDSARKLLLLQEKTFRNTPGSTTLPLDILVPTEPEFSFSRSEELGPIDIDGSIHVRSLCGKSRLNPIRFWWYSATFFRKLACILYGPALLLVPSFHQALDQPGNRPWLPIENLHFSYWSNWALFQGVPCKPLSKKDEAELRAKLVRDEQERRRAFDARQENGDVERRDPISIPLSRPELLPRAVTV